VTRLLMTNIYMVFFIVIISKGIIIYHQKKRV